MSDAAHNDTPRCGGLTFAYPNELLLAIKAFREGQRRLSHATPRPDLPADDRLLSCLEACFQASLRREETRPVRFTLLLANPEQIEASSKYHKVHWRSFPFAAPRSLTPHELVRLAPATLPGQTLIGADLTLEHPSLWGLLQSTSGLPAYGAGNPDNIFQPPGLLLSIRGPGAIFVHDPWPSVALEGGRIRKATAFPLNAEPVSKALRRLVGRLERECRKQLGPTMEADEPRIKIDTDSGYLGFVDSIGRITKELGHGGAFLFVPEDWDLTDTRLTSRLKVKYALNDCTAWPAILDEALASIRAWQASNAAFNRSSLTPEDLKQLNLRTSAQMMTAERTRSLARLLASLTQVDGAVLVTYDLKLLGFGCEVQGHSTLEQVVLASDSPSDPGVRVGIDQFGTRHRSAMRFCADVEGALALVVSQDGGLRAITRVGKDVCCWSG